MHEDMQHRLAERKPSTLLSVAPPDKQRAKRTVRSVARSAIVSSGKADTSDRETNFGAGGEKWKVQLTSLFLHVSMGYCLINYSI